jgi:N-acetylglucosamine-6-phosphate deacetylase
MKKVILSIASMMVLSVGHSQWTYKVVNNGFDDPYRVAYTAVNDGAILKLEKVEDAVAFYITGGYYCEDYPIVDLVFVVNGEDIKFYCEATTADDRETVFIIDDILTSNALDEFKNCSILKVRVNESYCDTKTYFFNMKGSTAALNYIKSE